MVSSDVQEMPEISRSQALVMQSSLDSYVLPDLQLNPAIGSRCSVVLK